MLKRTCVCAEVFFSFQFFWKAGMSKPFTWNQDLSPVFSSHCYWMPSGEITCEFEEWCALNIRAWPMNELINTRSRLKPPSEYHLRSWSCISESIWLGLSSGFWCHECCHLDCSEHGQIENSACFKGTLVWSDWYSRCPITQYGGLSDEHMIWKAMCLRCSESCLFKNFSDNRDVSL